MSYISPLASLAEFEEARDRFLKGKGPVFISGVIDCARAYLAHEIAGEGRAKLIITYNETRAGELADDAGCFDEEVKIFPAKDLLFYQADVSGGYLTKRRMDVIKALLAGKDITVITTIDALFERLAASSYMEDAVVNIAVGSQIDLSDLEKKLAYMGYERYDQIDAQGQFAVRGGIVDIFPISDEDPVRIEFFGDEVDSIRTFDIESQRSIENIDAIDIFPAAEISVGAGAAGDAGAGSSDSAGAGVKDSSLLDYFSANAAIFLDEPTRLFEKAEAVHKEFHESVISRLEAGYEEEHEIPELFTPDEVFAQLEDKKPIAFSILDQKEKHIKYAYACSINTQAVPTYMGQFGELVTDLKKWSKEKARVVLLAGSSKRAERLAREINDAGAKAVFSKNFIGEDVPAGMTLVVPGNIKKGFSYPFIRFYLLSEGDLFGREKKKRRRRSESTAAKITELSSLNAGDYVIHENHGLGIYQGTEKIERNGIARDYMKIVYGDGGMLYTPVTQMNLISKYADSEAEKIPRLNRLGGSEWQKTKTRVKSAVKDIAADLIKLYASRNSGTGYAYAPDTLWQKEFEEQFAFEETEDQIRAIEDTKRDMESSRIMDRLICGDVGFGKTEIAIRAAFKAVQEGKQVAYLVPTTILAQQHYNTFVQRLKNYGPNIELLCRFRSAAEQKKVIAGLKSGLVDIVIGTHRLLSKDIEFKDLGLLVIDEEQRFGVTHKEKIKQLKESVDVLSLTATPIPRTLHMSLIGVRDMSILREAPLDRMPIQTYVMEYNGEIAREAMARELSRGGQVYYVYNNIKNIAGMAAQIKQLMPDAEVAYAHGKMKERELEQIMLDFINGDIDILVSTTIIETGLDISNVNTIIIHGAEKYGLSQLYQLRGRVGRSSRTAYAFLFYRKDRELKEIAEKRLTAIKEYTDLGSGIKIAMRDLELRGAGNLLGAEQHGHMEAVGYDMYCKLLGDAVKEAKGEKKITVDFETEIDIVIDAYLPDDYVKDEASRIGVYRRIAGIENSDELMDVQDELIDRFGDIPMSVQNLIRISLIRQLAHEAYITELTGDRDRLKFAMYDKAPVDTSKIATVLESYKGDLRIVSGKQTAFVYTDRRKRCTSNARLLETIEAIISDISGLIE